MPELLQANISVKIDGTTYEGQYTVNIKKQLLHVRSEYGSKTTLTSIPSQYGTLLEDNKLLAEVTLRQIVSDFLRETQRNKNYET